MNETASVSWQLIRNTIMTRIRTRAYPPGQLIPNEADLAVEFGCARATVNRALRDLAASGFLDRRRKAGTRVIETPRRKAVLDIPLIRAEIEERGQNYEYRLLGQRMTGPPVNMNFGALRPNGPMLHIQSLHLADGKTHMFEDRWIHLKTVPTLTNVDFTRISPNEWLVRNAPYTHGSMKFYAKAAGPYAQMLDCQPNDPVLMMERITWMNDAPITYVQQYFARYYQLNLEL